MTPETLTLAMNELRNNLLRREAKHGSGGHHSSHETLGILMEEMKEYTDEVCANDTHSQFYELCDVATAAIVGMASLLARKRL